MNEVKDRVAALANEIQRLRPHYQSNSFLDHGRRQMLDHFEKILNEERHFVTAIEKIDALIEEADQQRIFHKKRGQSGYIEASAAAIRIKALTDSRAIIAEGHDR